MNKENKRIMVTIKNPYTDNGLEYKEEIEQPLSDEVERKVIDDTLFIGVPKEELDKAFKKYVENFKVYKAKNTKRINILYFLLGLICIIIGIILLLI